MAFDRGIIEAELALDLIGSVDMPKIAWDALEAGPDGRAIRRLAALNLPTYFEMIEVLPQAKEEMGLVKLSRGAAAFRLAKNHASEILERADGPFRQIRYFEQLWIQAGYPREIRSVGNLGDEVDLARYNQSDNEIRKWVTERLRKLVGIGEVT